MQSVGTMPLVTKDTYSLMGDNSRNGGC